MVVDNRTPGRNRPLPNSANKLKDDVERLIDQAMGDDADITDILLALGQKAALLHTHAIGDVTGLVDALAGKIAVGYHDALADLSDVDVTGAANGQVIIRQAGAWIPVSLQVGNITNLETLLDTKSPLANPVFTGTPTVPTAAPGTNTLQAASTAFVMAAFTALANGVSAAYDTLKEIADDLTTRWNAAVVHALAGKTTPVDADELPIIDSEAANVGKKLTFANLKALLLTYFLPLFARRIDARRNLLVNGSMQISQENGNTLGTTNGYYPADQWALYFSAATAAMSVQRVQARTLAGALDQIEFKTTTAKAVLAAGDFVTLTQNIEGSNPDFVAAQFGTANAKSLVLRKEVKRPAGLYHFHFQNSAGNRHCAVPYTVSAGEANTAVIKEIIVPPDTGGTWLTADGVIGITVDDVLAAGSTKTGGSASTWGPTAFYAASTQFNILSSTSNVARLADVGVRLDPDATGIYGAYEVGEVDPVYRSERYVCKISNDIAASASIAAGVYSDPSLFVCAVNFPVQMCKSPGFGVSGATDFNVYPRALDTTGISADSLTRTSARLLVTVSGGGAYEAGLLRFDGGASRYLFFPARLS